MEIGRFGVRVDAVEGDGTAGGVVLEIGLSPARSRYAEGGPARTVPLPTPSCELCLDRL